MRTRLATGLLAALVLLAGAPAEAADPIEITGQLLDAEGKPAADIEVATYWIAKDGRWGARQGVRTDAEGNFSMKVRLSSRARSVMALDATQAHGAVATLSAESAEKPLELKLHPTTLVTGAFENKGLGYTIEKTYVSFSAHPARIAIASHMGAPTYSLRLPPGDYRLMVGGVDCERIRQRVTVTKDMRAVDMGTTDLKPTIIAQHYGKAPPAWTVSDARGIDPKATLGDFKGKWVLLEFWGHW